MNLNDAVARATAVLAHLPAPRKEAIALVLASSGLSQTEWLTRPERPVDQARFEQWLTRRRAGESLASLRGQAGFMAFDLSVGHGVLIPRPDTELFAEVPVADGPVVDLGTGSGALALLAKARFPSRTVLAVERSPMALHYARKNAHRLGLSIQFVRGSWLSGFASNCLGNVWSNPPYIDASEPELTGDGVCREPREALVAEESGLADLKRIATQALLVLKPRGYLWLEHGHAQGQAVRELLTLLGYSQVETRQDLAGLDRLTGGRRG